MAWYMVYRTIDGRPVSETTVEPPRLRAGLAYKEIAERVEAGKMWDDATASLVDRPAKILVNRIDEVVTDYQIRGGRLNATDEAALRATLEAEFEDEELVRNTR